MDNNNSLTGGGGIHLGGALNALSLSPDGTQAVVAGREVLKIVSITSPSLSSSSSSSTDHPVTSSFKEIHNLRVGKINLNYSSIDAKWHPQEQHKAMIATAATNGAVVIWNINKEGQKQERVINEHTRTVNRIAWHPEHAYTLLSASQDGTMKLWDIRDPSNCKVTFDGKAEAVRDVQFSSYANYFAAAFDNGTVQIWDIRKHSSCERKITGHQGPVFCIDWHPDDKNLIASGGRDRFIQVWELNQTTSKPLYSVQTVSSVSHINWRPGSKFQIASTGLMDSKIHVWDLKKPFIPCYSFTGHQDVVADIQWAKGNTGSTKIYSCGKDCALLQQNIKNAYRPYEHIRTVGLSWSPQGNLAIVADKVNRSNQETEQPSSLVFPSFFTFSSSNLQVATTTENDKSKKGHMKMYSVMPSTIETSLGKRAAKATEKSMVFVYLAQHYKLKEPNISFEDLCDHNSQVAQDAKQYQISQVWKILKLLLYNDVKPTPNGGNKLSSVPPSPSPPTKHLGHDHPKGHTRQVSSEESNLLSDYSLNVFDPLITIEEDTDTPTMFGSTIDEGSFLSSDVSFPLAPLPVSSILETPTLTKMDPSPRFFPAKQIPIDTETSVEDLDSQSDLFTQELSFDAAPFIVDTLQLYAQTGDVQTAVVMSMVLGDRIYLDSTQRRSWALAYIELLQRMKLWALANDLIKKSEDKSVGIMNQSSTSIHTSCPDCNKPIVSIGWRCDTCKKPTNPCSLCHQRVRGLYVWCQGCAHGGHIDHIREWFATETACPSGCGHICTEDRVIL